VVIGKLFSTALATTVCPCRGQLLQAGARLALDYNPIIAGILAGAPMWPAIIGGSYHAVILPIVLLEMENTGHSFLGAVDMLGLVMVAAGISLANIIAQRERSEQQRQARRFSSMRHSVLLLNRPTRSCSRTRLCI
jgi:hypothetical protein